jgi:hypothetical protein
MAKRYPKLSQTVNFAPLHTPFEVQAKKLANAWLSASSPAETRDTFSGFSAAKLNGYVLLMQFDEGKPVGVVAVHQDYCTSLMETFNRAATGPDFGAAPMAAGEEAVEDSDDVSAG